MANQKTAGWISLLGVSYRYNETAIGQVLDQVGMPIPITRKDILGLSPIYLTSILPLVGQELIFVFVVDQEALHLNPDLATREHKIVVSHREGGIVGTMKFGVAGVSSGELTQKFVILGTPLQYIFTDEGDYFLHTENNGENLLAGHFRIQFVPALALTAERVHAIKSDPMATKFVRMQIGCNDCGSTIKIMCGIDKAAKNVDGYTWYENLPDVFVCTCGKVKAKLRYLREGLPSMLGYRSRSLSLGAAIEREYSDSTLERIVRDFAKLIDQDGVSEEEVQKYIEKHPILLSSFTPELLKFKASVTAKYKTDFALLNQKKELVLIEIEKPSTPLFTKTGEQHSQLTHAIGQVENWLQIGRTNRLALITDLDMDGVRLDGITNVKGVVIAGRSKEEHLPYLEKVRSRGHIDFYTYDELLLAAQYHINSFRTI